jgi:hypothetical protein
MTSSASRLLDRVRSICLAFPEVTERPSHSAPTFFVRNKKAFVNAWVDGHHGDIFPHLWCAAPAGMQDSLLSRGDARFFRPPYVGFRGWIGVRLDVGLDWNDIAELCEDAYRTVAPAGLTASLDRPSPSSSE